jgi:hypothetical protein
MKNELNTCFQQKFATSSYGVRIGRAWCSQKACELCSSLVQKKKLKKNYFSSHKLPKQQSTNFWSEGILGVNKFCCMMLANFNIQQLGICILIPFICKEKKISFYNFLFGGEVYSWDITFCTYYLSEFCLRPLKFVSFVHFNQFKNQKIKNQFLHINGI